MAMSAAQSDEIKVSNCILIRVLMRMKSIPRETKKYILSNVLGLIDRVCSDLERIINMNDSIKNTLAAATEVCVLTGGRNDQSRRRTSRRQTRSVR